jgi:hypothetical protein
MVDSLCLSFNLHKGGALPCEWAAPDSIGSRYRSITLKDEWTFNLRRAGRLKRLQGARSGACYAKPTREMPYGMTAGCAGAGSAGIRETHHDRSALSLGDVAHARLAPG